MREPNLRTSRLAIAGGLAAALAIGTAGFLAGRATVAPPPPPPETIAAQQPAEVPPTPELPRILRRAEILAFADAAADAAASGLALPQSIVELGGRRFELALPFGCHGPAGGGDGPPMRWQYDPRNRTLRVQIAATRWTLSDWGLGGVSLADSGRAETRDPGGMAEGFWLDRPWSSAETCPRQAGRPDGDDRPPGQASPRSLALAHFEPTGSSAGRGPPRSFEVVKRMEPGEFDLSQGLRLRLTGRIENLAGTPPVHCLQTGGSDQRPVCVISASFEEVAVESAASGEVIATWSLGQATGPN
jgi:hypothetical protein